MIGLKWILILIMIGGLLLFSSPSADIPEQPEPSVQAELTEQTEPVKIRYEAVYLNYDELQNLLQEIRGDAPYPKHSNNPHVTIAFNPEEDARDLYGQKVDVHIIGYKAGEVSDDNGGTTSVEGLKVELVTENEAMAAYIARFEKNFHITGSYVDGAKYTENLDFSDMQPLDYTLTGTFGAELEGHIIIFDAADMNQTGNE